MIGEAKHATAETSEPPLEPPLMMTFPGAAYLFATSQSLRETTWDHLKKI